MRGAGADPLPTLEIRSRMIEQTPGITRLLDNLEKGGWVTRNRCMDDRRQVLCRITPRGKKLLSGLDAPIEALYDEVLGHVPDHEVKALVRAMDKLRSRQSEKGQPQTGTGSAA